MKGPVILLLVALIVVLDQAASDQAMRHRAVPFWSMSHLLEHLAEPMTGTTTKVAKEVFRLLMDTSRQYKDTTSSRLNGFTISQLIDLNEISIADCEDDKLEERRNTCEKFSTKELTKSVRPPKREMVDGDLMDREKDQINLNLAKYCWEIIEILGDYCPYKRVQTIDNDAMKRLSSFSEEVLSDTIKRIFFWNTKKLVQERLKKLEETEREEAEELKETCSSIMKEYKKSDKYFKNDITFPYRIEVCEVIEEIKNGATLPATQSANDDQASS